MKITTCIHTTVCSPRFRLLKAWLILAVLLAAWVPLQAQDSGLGSLLDRATSAGIEQSRIDEFQSRATRLQMSDQDIQAMLEPAVSLAESNLPSDMIFQKALEGMAKRIPTGQMVPILREIERGTHSVVPMVNEWVEREEVGRMLQSSGERYDKESLRNEMTKVSARAVSQQITLESVQSMLQTMSDQDITANSRPSSVLASISIMPDIPSVAQSGAARGMLVRAVQSGFSASDLQRLPGAMNVAQRRSQLPAAAVIEGVHDQMQGGVPAAVILQNLFNGEVGGGPPGMIRRGQGQGQGQGQGAGQDRGPDVVNPGQGPDTNRGQGQGSGNQGPGNNPGQGPGNQGPGGNPGQGPGN